MPVLFKKDASCLFLHIPKTGGSAFLDLAQAMNWRVEMTIRGMSATRLSALVCAPQHFHWSILQQVVHPDGFDRILAITRHPFSRLVSEHRWQRTQKLTTLDLRTWVEDSLEGYAKDPFVHDNHIRPQSQFIPDTRPESMRIFKLEDRGVARAGRELGQLTAGKARGNLLHRLPVTGRSSSVLALPEVLEDLRDDIVGLYAEDFERFGYEPS